VLPGSTNDSVLTLVLVTEDEPILRSSAEEMLAEGGYDTVSAGSVAEATDALENRPEINLLFTDIGLRSELEGGLTLAQDARMTRPNLLVLYTTGGILTDKMKTAFVKGSRFIAKPYTCAEVRETLATLLRCNQGGSQQVGPNAATL
jgi:CheY-like chemotaxis protein